MLRRAGGRIGRPFARPQAARPQRTAAPRAQKIEPQRNAAPAAPQRSAAPAAPQRNAAPATRNPGAQGANPQGANPQGANPQAGNPLGNLFGGALDRLGRAVGPNVTPERRAALEGVRDMLEPNRLGGPDRTFNFADRDAVVQSLLRDTPGLSAEAQGRLLAEGKPFQARLVERGMAGGRGPLASMARRQVYEQAGPELRRQLDTGLRQAQVDPATGQNPDATPRNVTIADMRRFEQNARVLQEMQREISDRLGVDITFPNGISQAGIQHTLDGRFGLPPGAVVRRR